MKEMKVTATRSKGSILEPSSISKAPLEADLAEINLNEREVARLFSTKADMVSAMYNVASKRSQTQVEKYTIEQYAERKFGHEAGDEATKITQYLLE